MGIRPVLCVLALVGMLAPGPAAAEVLGACGTKDAKKPAKAAVTGSASASAALPAFTRVPLPGEQAPNFELPAVVGKQIKKIKLSDFDGKWRVVCFYPADFTFV
jgi:hypothetical protein